MLIMRKALLPIVLLVFLTLLTGSIKDKRIESLSFGKDVSVCGGEFTPFVKPRSDGKYIPLMPGTGSGHYAITSDSDSAQVYFNQGLSFYYGYHLTEALASFKEAARFDVNCLMAYWGQLLALGPFYNNSDYKMPVEVHNIVRLLKTSNKGANVKENDLSTAMLQRYSSDTTNADRKSLDLKYAHAMRELVRKYPSDNDITLLYIDATMLCHKWDFWNTDGTEKTWTPELVNLCEQLLIDNPGNPPAIHYYIHLTEASDHPQKALRYADHLRSYTPGIAHMVHMGTHSFQRNGFYSKGVSVNEQAFNVFKKQESLLGKTLSKYVPIHFFAVQSYCAMSAGMFLRGMPLFQRARERIIALEPSFNSDPYAQFVFMIPQIAMVRLGRWDQILKEPDPAKEWKYAVVMDCFAKGLAYVRKKDLPSAEGCLNKLKINLADTLLNIRRVPYNKPSQSGNIAANILAGEIAYAEGKKEEAIALFRKAVLLEDQLIYREPKEWLIPSRQYLGFYLLKMKKSKEAELVYKQDLVKNPANGWSLIGMYHTAKAQHKDLDAKTYWEQYELAFITSDLKPLNSIY
jgi:tetratricopeptide (TPR) repeat protein